MEFTKREREDDIDDEEDNEEVKRARKLEFLKLANSKNGDKFTVASNVKPGLQAFIGISEVRAGISKSGEPYTIITGVLLRDSKSPDSTEVVVPHKFTTIEVQMKKLLLAGKKLPPRPPMTFKNGEQWVSFCVFEKLDDTLIVPGCECFVTGINFEIRHHKGKGAASSAAVKDDFDFGNSNEDKKLTNMFSQGDAYIEFVANGVYPKRMFTDNELITVFSKCPLKPVGQLLYAIRAKYPTPINRCNVTGVGKGGKGSFSDAMIHWDMSNELLLSRRPVRPLVYFLVNNHMYNYMDNNYYLTPPEYFSSGITVMTSLIPEIEDLTYETMTGERKCGVRGSKEECDGNWRFTTSEIDKEFCQLFGNLRSDDVEKFGIQSTDVWKRCGQQIIRGLCAVMQLQVDVDKSQCVVEMGFNLKGGYLSMVRVLYERTFNLVGYKVNYPFMKMCLVKLTDKVEGAEEDFVNVGGDTSAGSELCSELLKNQNNMKISCICLNECRGQLNKIITRPEDWAYYMIPNSDYFAAAIKDYKKFFEKTQLAEKNAVDEKQRIDELTANIYQDEEKLIKMNFFAFRKNMKL